jgi:hypothetical protein
VPPVFWLIAAGLAMLAALAVSGPSAASELRWSDPPGYVLPPHDHLRVGLDVLVDGRPLPVIHHYGRDYLAVPYMGAEYQVRVWNGGPLRVVALVSVDGLSVIDGRPASENSPGYVVSAGGSIVIRGWRRDLQTVAAFRFTDREDSYAYRTGRPEDVGVIRLVAIEEMAYRPRPDVYRLDAERGAAKSAAAGDVGTGYGRDVDSRAYLTSFVRGPHRRTIPLYYDTVGGLRRLGVPVNGPEPYPRDLEFALPPPRR